MLESDSGYPLGKNRLIMNIAEFLPELRAHIAKKYTTKKKAAEAWGLSPQYVGRIVSGKQPVPAWILKEMGYKKTVTVTFEYVEEAE